MNPTPFPSVPEAGSLNLFDLSVGQTKLTKGLAEEDSSYKGGPEAPSVTELRPTPVQASLTERRTSSKASAGVSAGRHFRGVVDQVAAASSHVTLHYGGRDNEFVLPTPVLENAGIAYMGALFEIVMKKEAGLHSYDIVHLADEEARIRREAPPADLSFLDGIEAPVRRK